MKSSFTRSDIIPCKNSFESNLQKQMSQLLEVKNMLYAKLDLITKNIEKDVGNFVTKHYPHQNGKFSPIDMEFNLFGTSATYQEFNSQYMNLFTSLEADIKGVVEVLEKFPVMKPLSQFINIGIVDNLLKLNKLMLYREEHCQKLMKQLQQNILNNKPMHSMNYKQTQLCKACHYHMEHQNVIQAKQMIQFGGEKIYNYYRRHIQKKMASEEDEEDQGRNSIGSFYERIMESKKKMKRVVGGLDDDEMMTQESLKYTLDKLQSNLEQRKYDILACLVEMGQFGTELGKSFGKTGDKKGEKVEKTQQKQIEKEAVQNTIELLRQKLQMPQLTRLVPKFNYQKFTFDLGKHFCKQIKDIQGQLAAIKNKYSELLVHQMSKVDTKQTQCNTIKDSFDQQMDKHKKKTQRKISLLHGRITELEQNNKELKNKLDETTSITKKSLATKVDLDKVEVEKRAVEMTMQKLVDKYEAKLKQQQNQLKQLKKKEVSSKNKLKELMVEKQHLVQKLHSSVSIAANNSGEFTINKLQDYEQNYEGQVKKPQHKKKISMFLQPIMKRTYEKNENPSVSGQSNTSNTLQNSSGLYGHRNSKADNKRVSVDLPAAMLKSNPGSQKEITELTIENYIDSTGQMTSSVQVNPNNNYTNQTGSNNGGSSKAIIASQNKIKRPNSKIVKAHLAINNKMISVVINPHLIRDKKSKSKDHMSGSVENGKKLPVINSKSGLKNKLIKAKSYQDAQMFKTQMGTDQINNKLPINNNNKQGQLLKRYVSEHSTYKGEKSGGSVRKSLRDKSNRKISKTLSLTMIKKDEGQTVGNGVKLPSLSQYEKGATGNTHQTKSSEKLKGIEKLGPGNNNSKNGLKKKRKRRNFSQEQFGVDLVFENGANMGGSINQGKQKKKEYIIDFIPKVEEEQQIAKCKEQYSSIVETQIQGLFAVVQESVQTSQANQVEAKQTQVVTHAGENQKRDKTQKNEKIQRTKRGLVEHQIQRTKRGLVEQQIQKKHNKISPNHSINTKIIMVTGSKSPLSTNSPQVSTRLSNNQISLSTKLYSAMAQVKSTNISLYKLIRQKLYLQYKKDHILEHHPTQSSNQGPTDRNQRDNTQIHREIGTDQNVPNYYTSILDKAQRQERQEKQDKKRVKTNCDLRTYHQSSDSCDNNKSQQQNKSYQKNKSLEQTPKHIPISILSIKKAQIHEQGKEQSQQANGSSNKGSRFQGISVNGDQTSEQNREKSKRSQGKQVRQNKENKQSGFKECDEKQLRMIINSLIVKHRNHSCSPEHQIQSHSHRSLTDNKQNHESSIQSKHHCCKHLTDFFKFLNHCRTLPCK